MYFYVIANGYQSDGYIRAYVAAENDDRARELASEVFKRDAFNVRNPAQPLYPEKYYAVPFLEIVHRLDSSVEGAVQEID